MHIVAHDAYPISIICTSGRRTLSTFALLANQRFEPWLQLLCFRRRRAPDRRTTSAIKVANKNISDYTAAWLNSCMEGFYVLFHWLRWA